jgi:hypothetical protein
MVGFTIRFFANDRTSIEVDEGAMQVWAVFMEDGRPLWRLQVVGQVPTVRAVGTVADSFQAVSPGADGWR